MKTAWAGGMLLASCFALGATAEDRMYFKKDLLFYASYDNSADADFAAGDGRCLSPMKKGPVEGKQGRGLLFGAKNGVRFCEYRAAGNIRPDCGTIAFYFKPGWSGEDFKSRQFFFWPGAQNPGSGANFPDSMAVHTMKYQKPEQELWLWYDDHGGGNNTVRGRIDHWRAGQWYHVAVTWDPQWLHVYLDGKLSGRQKRKGQISDPGEPFFIGSGRNGAFLSDGVLDEFYIYARALSLAEVGLLTGRPEFVVPRIHALTLAQSMFFQSERHVPFRCQLTGRIDAKAHRLRATVTAEDGKKPIVTSEFPAAGGRYAVQLLHSVPEGRYHLSVGLLDAQGKELDRKSAPLFVITGPFDTD